MARGKYSAGKRRREAERARKRQDKADRLRRNREQSPGEIPIASADEIQSVSNLPLPGTDDGDGDGEAPKRRASGPPCRLFVGGLSWGTSEEELRSVFAEYGDITDAIIVTDRDTGRSRGFGFVTMANRKDAAKAIKELDGRELDGRMVKVNVATERSR